MDASVLGLKACVGGSATAGGPAKSLRVHRMERDTEARSSIAAIGPSRSSLRGPRRMRLVAFPMVFEWFLNDF